MSREFEGHVAKERVNSGEAQIAAANAQSPLPLELIEKRHDQRRVDLLEHQRVRRLLQTLLRELQKQAEGVAIGTDRVGADPALLHQTLDEETLEKRSKAGGGGHGRCSQRRSSRDIASRINSGEALKYHCVSATCTWPRNALKRGRRRSGS
jgi:hypothetical protein